MDEIDFASLLSKLMEFDDDSDEFEEEEEEEEYPDLDDDSEKQSEEDLSDNLLDMKNIASMEFEKVKFEKYEKIKEKCQKRIISLEENSIRSVWKYCSQYLSSNIPLLFYIILECLEKKQLILIPICEMIKFIKYNYDQEEFVHYFCIAAYTYRLSFDNYNIIHTIMLQLLYSTHVLSLNNSETILQVLIGPKQIVKHELFFSEKLTFLRKETVTENYKKSKFQKELLNFQKILDELHTLSEDENQQGSNDIMEELIMLDKVHKNKRRYSSRFLAICTVAYIYGPKSYSFLRQYFAFPHETTLRKWFSPDVQKYRKNN